MANHSCQSVLFMIHGAVHSKDFIIPVKSLALDKPCQGGLGDVGKFAAMHAAAKGSVQLRFRAVAVSEVRMERWGRYR